MPRYASVRRFVRQLRRTAPPEARVVIATTPGDEAQVDYGDGPMVRHPETGKRRRTWLFVLTLAHSRKAARLLVWQSSAQTWAELHERAFRRLGGTPRTVVLDNLKEGVLTPDIYEPTLNPLYRDVLAHYGVIGLPCRVGDPDRKGKVESGIGHTQKTPPHGQRFDSLAQAQAYLDRWEAHWADTHIHGTTKRQVVAMFAEERPALQPLPVEPFRYYRFGMRTVHLDGCVEVEAAYYSTPPGWIGQRLQVQWTDLHVRVLDPKAGQLLREHVRAPRGHHRIADPDRPARTPTGTLALLARARHAGVHLHAVCAHIHEHEGAAGVRRMLGVLALAKQNAHEPRRTRHRTPEYSGSPVWRPTLEARLRQAQSERQVPIDFVSALVSDELIRRQDRLIARRIQQARFRDVDRSLDTFDLDFNKKMNRALIHDLATGRFIQQREDVLLLGPPGTGKSHLAQALGRAAILQGHRVLYREAHLLLAELADATLDGTRKDFVADLTAVPLLIIDDLSMRKLPHTAAEDLLEIIMRRYERASTLLTSNRPVDDWGRLLGDTAAVTALLDRLLHHAHVLTCGPRSWRTKVRTDLRTEDVPK